MEFWREGSLAKLFSVLVKDPGLVPHPQGKSQTPVVSVPGDLTPSSGLCKRLHTHGAHTVFSGKTIIYKN